MNQIELKTLLADMSLEEKVYQLLQVTSGFFNQETVLTGPMRDGGFSEESIAGAGSIIGLFGAKKYKEVQHTYMQQQPHGIPFLMMLDVINGFKTVFPIPLGQGAAFDPELAGRCAQMAAKEAAVSGVHVTFSPMLDLVRDARWGRVMESTGEDCKLNADYAEAIVKGYQGEDVSEPYRIAACVKHFAGYGAPTAGREYNTVELSENTLRNFYMPAYEAAVKAGAKVVMASFNTLNGIPSTGNRHLMREVLRKELGFEGVLISDWAGIEEMINHGYASDRKHAAELAMNAGVDVDMMTGIYSKELPELIKEEMLPMELLDEAVLRVLELKNQMGLFENPYKDADENLEKEIVLCKENRKLAREAAEKSFVLLENDEILPLKQLEKIAFIGPFVDEKEIYGAWSMLANAEDTVSIKEAVLASLDDYQITFAKGTPILGAEDYQLVPDHIAEQIAKEQENLCLEELLAGAVEAAKTADKVVLTLGEHRCMSGEAASRAMLDLPAIQQKLLNAIYEVNPNIVVVLFSGRPLDLREVKAHAKAILQVWMPGTEGGNAIWNVLKGQAEPVGRLPISFPYCVGQVPVHYDEFTTGRPYKDGAKERQYLSNYRDIPNKPLYPFGYGMGYTTFSYSNLTLDTDIMREGETIQASVVLKNTGANHGVETVQLYIRDCVGSVVRPGKQLKDYQKVALNPGEERKVIFTITEDQLSFYRADGTYGCEPGEFQVFIGKDSNVEEFQSFVLK